MRSDSSRFSLPRSYDPVIEASKRDVDRTLPRENRKLTPEGRLRKLVESLRFTEELSDNRPRAAPRGTRRR
jgi:hypothetical protein